MQLCMVLLLLDQLIANPIEKLTTSISHLIDILYSQSKPVLRYIVYNRYVTDSSSQRRDDTDAKLSLQTFKHLLNFFQAFGF